jgi:hypothetical protein
LRRKKTAETAKNLLTFYVNGVLITFFRLLGWSIKESNQRASFSESSGSVKRQRKKAKSVDENTSPAVRVSPSTGPKQSNDFHPSEALRKAEMGKSTLCLSCSCLMDAIQMAESTLRLVRARFVESIISGEAGRFHPVGEIFMINYSAVGRCERSGPRKEI